MSNFLLEKIVKIQWFWFVLLLTTLNSWQKLSIFFGFFTNFIELRNPQFFLWIWSCQQKKLWFREFELFTVKTFNFTSESYILDPESGWTFDIYLNFIFFFRRLKIHPDKTEVISWEKTMVEVEISCSNGWTAVPYCDNRLILQKSLLQKRN